MATPDYLEQVVVSGRRRSVSDGAPTAPVGLLYRPSVTSLIWATLDLLTIVVAAIGALRFRFDIPSNVEATSTVPYLVHTAHWVTWGYIGWFGLLLVILARSYGLYGPILSRNGLNEQRMTVQATLIAGLLLCGTLYLRRAEMVSREVVILLVV